MAYDEVAQRLDDLEFVVKKAVEMERERCLAVCESWIGTYQDRDIKFTSPREYAVGAVEDIAELIRDGVDPRKKSDPLTTAERT